MTTETIADRAEEILFRATLAAAEFQQLDQQATDAIVRAVFTAGFNNRVRLAKMAWEETGIGVWQHKVLKNVVATQLVYENIKEQKTVGVISRDDLLGIVQIAQPLGPIFAIIPVTNPTSTTLFKILIAMKTRNPVIISPPRKAIHCCAETVRVCYQAALAAGAPEGCIQIVEEGSRELTRAIMGHQSLALTLATGGTGMVHAAYSSGNPAIGVGPGNVPVFIDQTADIPFAVANIITSKTFDNGTICASEQAVVVEKSIAAAVRQEFARQHCYFVADSELPRLAAYAIVAESGGMNPDIVGKSARSIADQAGLELPEDVQIILARLHGVGDAFPLSKEILAPILAFYECDDYQEAMKTCIDLNFLGGIGHTVAIYANDEERIDEFSRIMNAGRVIVNTPSAQGAVGGLFNTLQSSLTLGCGTGGKNITTENISALHLLNIQRVCRRRENPHWFKFDTNRYYDESADAETLLQAYYRNY